MNVSAYYKSPDHAFTLLHGDSIKLLNQFDFKFEFACLYALVFPRLLRLGPGSVVCLLDFPDGYLHRVDILFGLQDLVLGFLAFDLVTRYPGSLFEYRASAFRAHCEYLLDPALFEDAVCAFADTRVEKQLLYVPQPCKFPVYVIFVPSFPVDLPLYLDLGKRAFQNACAVVDRERYLSRCHRLSSVVAVEDDIFHLPRPERFRTLLPQYPLDAVNDVALSASVRAEECGYSRREIYMSPVCKAFEAVHVE